MTEEQTQTLHKDFPNLYREPIYFECGSGWYSIIYNLSEKLEKLILSLSGEERQYCYVSQVKEKFGTLRFYMSRGCPEMEVLIDKAEDLTEVTCEKCGEPGTIKGRSWVYVACPVHTRPGD